MFPLLDVDNLSITLGDTPVVREASFNVLPKETVALVGESGCGKSLTALSILGLLDRRCISGNIRFAGRELLDLPEEILCRYRGRCMGAVFQDPTTSLDPLMPIGKQIAEGTKKSAREVVELLELVGISRPEERQHSYPHQLSGGMRQRVMIAAALAHEPQLLIADEPTTSLDTTTQAQILALLESVQKQFGMSLLLITHDFSVVSKMCDRVFVMRAGSIVEEGSPDFLYHHSMNSYTQLLVHKRIPVSKQSRAVTTPLITIENASKHYGTTCAIHDVSLSIQQGETLALVGESGSGKSTLAKLLVGLEVPSGGTVQRLPPKQIQMVFQNPYASLDPNMTIEQILSEPFKIHRLPYDDHTLDTLMHRVGLSIDFLDRYPRALSGGQRQRVAIARAIAIHPKVLVLDEPLSALDLTAQQQILALLQELKRRSPMTYIFITHDLEVAQEVADRVAVMYQGKIVELETAERFFEVPQHDYSRSLLKALLSRDPRKNKQLLQNKEQSGMILSAPST